MALVYRHRNPKTLEVFYVGISCNKDSWGMNNRPYDFIRRSDFHKRYVKKYGDPIVEVICEGISSDDAKELEIFLISEYGRRNLGTGTLVNLTDGGEGTVGRVVSEKTRIKNSNSNTGKIRSKKFGEECRNRALGRTKTKESISKSRINSPRRVEVVDNCSGFVYTSIRQAASDIGVSYGYLRNMLNGLRKNKTNLSLLNKK